jgi:uncharacterized protein (TIGR03083 family)
MTRLLPDADVTLAYRECRARIIELVRSLPEEDAGTIVPLCPEWTIAALVSHIIGVPDDILNGRLDGVATDAWTHAQVERFRGRSLSELADTYEASAAAFDAVLPMIPAPTNSQMVMDTVTHEHDLRHATGRAGAQDSLAVQAALGWWLDQAESAHPGAAETYASMGVSDYELLRSFSGRRSAAQIAGLGLDADALIAVLAGSPLTPPTTAIEV